MKIISINPAPPGLTAKIGIDSDTGDILLEKVVFLVFYLEDNEPEDGANILYLTDADIKSGYFLIKDIGGYELTGERI